MREELTQQMGIPQAMAQRMAAHLRECDQVHGIRPRDATAQRLYDEMKSIVSDLPKPVDLIDPDEARATELSRKWCGVHQPAILDAIKLGRTLAAGSTAHE